MIVKLDIFVQLETDGIMDPKLVQRFLSKSVGEYLARKGKNLIPIKLNKSEFEFVRQLGVKSPDLIFLSEEEVLKKLK